MRLKNGFVLLWLILLPLIACRGLFGNPQQAATSTPIQRTIQASTETPTITQTLSNTPTQTYTPSPSPTQTFTPTPLFLIEPGTPLPSPASTISVENAHLVSGLAKWHETTVSDLTWTPDGHLLAVANMDGVNLYDPSTRQILRTLYPSNKGLISISFSPLGSWLVAGSRYGSEDDGYISNLELWLGPDWKPMGVLYGVGRALSSTSFSPDGRVFAAAFTSPIYDQNGVEFWNVRTWTITDTLQTGTVLNVAFSPDGTLLATTPERYALRVWDLIEMESLYTLPTSFTGAVNAIAFSPDGLTLASGHYDGTIRLWDMNTGLLLRTIFSSEVIESLTFSSDGRILASGGSYENSLVRLWEVSTGILLRSLDGNMNAVGHLQFSPMSEYLVSGSYDGTIVLWGLTP